MEEFEIRYNDLVLNVAEHMVGNDRIFRVLFGNGKPALIVTRTTAPGNQTFWTSIPEGRQQEAEEIGELIAKEIKRRK
ncbi:hypothetical protein [Pedobacter sp. UBA4863]|uniref:hypothetical protein n=1 Tax=Pedobacter sp. UBA4863 TaxID=1947060 RepID=UPI0025E529C6|nr:hypothetical protein [Pedobacter sp. UBA4863]